jgi:hypothetical protein
MRRRSSLHIMSLNFTHRTWLDEDARTGVVLAMSMEDQFATNIVEFDRAHQMWTFLHNHYKPTR